MRNNNFGWMFTVVLVVACANVAHAIQDDSIRITLRSDLQTVFKPLVTITDVAKVTAANRSVESKIGKLDIDLFEDGKTSMTISATQLRCRLLLAGYTQQQMSIQGATSCSIEFAESIDIPKRLESAVRNEFAKQFAMQVEKVRVHLVNAGRLDQTLNSFEPGDENNLMIFEPKLPVGKSSVGLEWVTPDGEYHSAKVDFRFVIMREVVIAKRRINRGALIGDLDVKRVTRPMADNKIQPVSFEQCVGQVAASDISMHQLIQVQSVGSAETGRGPKLLKPNDIVDVIIKRGAITIKLMGAKVLSSGSVGDSVRLLNQDTKTKFMAVVIDKSTVTIR